MEDIKKSEPEVYEEEAELFLEAADEIVTRYIDSADYPLLKEQIKERFEELSKEKKWENMSK